MIYLSDSCNEEETYTRNTANKTGLHKQQRRFSELLRWISQEGSDFVYIETFADVKDVFTLLDIVESSQNPILTTILIRETEPNLVTISLSSVKVDVPCLLFCMF